MPVLTLTPEIAARVAELRKSSQQPKEILGLKKEILKRIRAVESKVAKNTPCDLEKEAKEIAQMKIDLDGLYLLWSEGKIS